MPVVRMRTIQNIKNNRKRTRVARAVLVFTVETALIIFYQPEGSGIVLIAITSYQLDV